jgi:hypothetical protein
MPQSTPAALLVIDMLLDYFRAGPLAEQRKALVDSLNLLLAEFRSRGLPIIWVRQEFREDLADAFLEMKSRKISITIAGTAGGSDPAGAGSTRQRRDCGEETVQCVLRDGSRPTAIGSASPDARCRGH